MGFIGWIAGGIRDFIGGMISEFFNFLVDCVVEIADKIGQILDAVLGLFGFVPLTLKLFDRLGRATFWFLPDVAFRMVEVGVSIIGIVVIVKFVLRMLGR